MKTLNLCYKTQFLERNTCQFTKSPYLCIVFFIVLDFKVNKGWSTAVLLFLCLQFRLSRKKLEKKFSKICEYRKNDLPLHRKSETVAQMAESVDALVSNTSGVTSIPVRPRVWVHKKADNRLIISLICFIGAY